MAIHKILIPIRGDGKGANVLAHAVAIARRFNAHIETVHCRARPEDLMPYGVAVPGFFKSQVLESAKELADAEEKHLREIFDQLVAANNLAAVDEIGPARDRVTISWREAIGRQVDVIKTYGRLADLIVVAKPDRDRNLGANTLKSALFNTGRPVLMCPPKKDPPSALGEKVAIAWNGSTEAARAVALSREIIASASEVVVLTAGEAAHGATAVDLIAYLAARGVLSRLEKFKARDDIGLTLLAETAKAGCDLLIMGAYGQSHERETVFGGNTQQVIDHAELPVLLVH